MRRIGQHVLTALAVLAAVFGVAVADAAIPDAAPQWPSPDAPPPAMPPPASVPVSPPAPPQAPVAPPEAPPEPPAVSTQLRRGDSGPAVVALQAQLTRLGYWNGAADGSYGVLTEQAVFALQKVEGLPRTGTVDTETAEVLRSAARPMPRSAAGDLIEIDKARQVLFVVRDGSVRWALNTSTGTERPYRSATGWDLADTPVGQWTIDREVDGLRRGALGSLYRPKYFHRDGIAIHGARDVPAYPASHGCARLTNAAVDMIWRENLAPIGSMVWIYAGTK